MENIIINTEYGYQELKPKDGYIITSYIDSDDIKTYNGSTEIDTPMDIDITKYRAITTEQHINYLKQKEEAISKEMEEMKNR